MRVVWSKIEVRMNVKVFLQVSVLIRFERKNEALIDLHARFSEEQQRRPNWKAVSAALTNLKIGPKRDPEACRKRWRQHLDREGQDPEQKSKKWTVIDVCVTNIIYALRHCSFEYRTRICWRRMNSSRTKALVGDLRGNLLQRK